MLGPLKWVGLVLVLVGLAFNALWPAGQVLDVEGSARVIDGDSLYVAGREVRMEGIDAPEGRQSCRRDGREYACGDEARKLLHRLIGGGQVFCEGHEIDKHGRLLALCSAGNVDLNREMVAQGFAVAYGRFREEEKAAKGGGKGLWAGEFTPPRDWRRERNIGL
ncbi:MAG: hypothetical protein APF80_15980 [Alphaproteobacteria bacterium BRH_c36]|nr:MAG: hypothetical protein APF80_15980 [Alphaproteobacteria bacterium BRH_c36]